MNLTKESIDELLDIIPGNNIVYRVTDGELKVVAINAEVLELTSITYEDFTKNTNQFNFISQEDRALIKEKVKFIISEHKNEIDMIFRLNHKTRGFIWVHLTAKRAGIMDGDPVFIANIIDVTREMNGSYSMTEASDRHICVIEKRTKRFLYANAGFYDLIDSNPEDAMGKYCYELLCKSFAMKDNNNCLCFSSLNAYEPIEYYNADKKKYLSMSGREIQWGDYDAYVFFLTDVTKMKEKEEELFDANKRFNMALENSEVMIWEYDMVNNRCINSEKAGKDYNIPLVIENYPESLFLTGHIPPETVEQIMDVKRRLFNGETNFSVERRTIDKNGKSQWQKVEYSLECNADGSPIRAIVCGLDITPQKELEAKYNGQIEYRNNLSKNSLFSVRFDMEERRVLDYISDDEMLEDRLRYAEEHDDFIKGFFVNAEFDLDSELAGGILSVTGLKEQYELGRSQFRTTYRCSLINKYLDLDISIYKNPKTGHLETFFVMADVTERIIMASAYQNVISKDYDLVAVINVRSKSAVVITENAEKISAKTIDYDKSILKFAEDNKRYYASEEDYKAVSEGIIIDNLVEHLKDVNIYEFNCRAILDDNAIHTYRLSFSYTPGKQEIIFTRTNITNLLNEEKKHQQELEKALEAARLAEKTKTEFLSRMSHDMRTPMNGILGLAQLSKEENDIDVMKEYLSQIELSGKVLLDLINDTLDMNKVDAGKLKLNPLPINSEEVFSNVITNAKIMAADKGIKLRLNMPDIGHGGWVPVVADASRLEQVLFNIISNAIKFTPSQGTVDLNFENIFIKDGVVRDRYIIKDSGIGMRPEFLPHVFDAFSQENRNRYGKDQGSGLGMSIVKRIVELMDGTIDIESEYEKGTTVTIVMNYPVYDGKIDKQSKQKEDFDVLKGKHILLCEDNPLNAQIACRLLEKKGLIVDLAENGQVGLEKYENSPMNYYQGILMDIRMPILDGIDTTKAIRALDRDDAERVPIIAMTANAFDEDVKLCISAGMNAHIAKPIDVQRMFCTIEKYMR